MKPKVRNVRKNDRAGTDLKYITADLRGLAVPIGSLKADPRNARVHDEKNLAAIAASLRANGQQKPISVDADGVILAGNGTWTAAKSLGWKHIARVRCELTGAKARAWAIQDNRSAELADWDVVELEKQTQEILDELADFDIEDLGFDEKQFEALLDGDFETSHGFTSERKEKPAAEPKIAATAEQWKIVIECTSEAQQAELLEKLSRDGVKCRALVA